MPVAKVIELVAHSPKSWEDAAKAALEEASKTVENIENIRIKEFQAVVENNKITKYRVDAKITFLVKGKGKS